MAVTNLVSGPLVFVQQLHEHSSKVYEAIGLVEPLADALMAQDYERVHTLHKQTSQIAAEADQSAFALYDQAKSMHFRPPGSYAFSRYISSQNRMASLTRDFADLLLSQRIAFPGRLRVAFQTLTAQVVSTSGQMIALAREFSSPVEADSTDRPGPDVRNTLADIREGNRRTRQFEMEFILQAHRQEEQVDAVTVLILDRYGTALRMIADAAERAAHHLCLVIP